MEIRQPTQPKVSKSKYELTLAEFPLFVLSKKDANKVSQLSYEDTIKGDQGKIVERKWTVYPDAKNGFGTASTQSTLFELFQIWKEDNFTNQHIQFGSIYDILKRKGIGKGSNEYRQIIRDLQCLVGITIEAKNAFWDNEKKAYVDMTFHLFDELALYKDRPGGQAALPFSRIKASDALYGSIQKNSLLFLNFDSQFFYSLTPIEQRLALYLSKIFRSQTMHKRNLLELARQIPIFAKQTKHIKESLKKACQGLKEKGFSQLEHFDFETQPGKKYFIIFYRAGKITRRKDRKKVDKDPIELKLLVEDILAICGDSRSEAFYNKVARLMPSETIYHVLSEVKEVRDSGDIKKSKGALFTSIIKKRAQDRGVEL